LLSATLETPQSEIFVQIKFPLVINTSLSFMYVGNYHSREYSKGSCAQMTRRNIHSSSSHSVGPAMSPPLIWKSRRDTPTQFFDQAAPFSWYETFAF
jgi:hypothetical protein